MSEFQKYFIYSATQYKLKVELEAKLGKKYVPGTVLVRGTPKQYTELTDNPNSIQFPDSEVVWAGDIRQAKYTEPKVQ